MAALSGEFIGLSIYWSFKLAPANQLAGLFPVDKTLERWLRNKATEAAILNNRTTRLRITHEKVDELFANPLTADRDAVYESSYI